MKMILTSADTPDAYVACLSGWQRDGVVALRGVITSAGAELEERLKWGHLVYFHDGLSQKPVRPEVSKGPVLLIRAEPQRVLFGFWRGQRLRHIEPRLKPGGKYEMATLELRQGTPFERSTAVSLVQAAALLGGESLAVRPRRVAGSSEGRRA